ncbi:MAG: hypothetical protein WD557_11490 [Dehalococcoidia bacterium]
MRRFLAGVILAVVIAAVGRGEASADVGVALDVGKIEIEQKLSRGGDYRLPMIGVRNPGSETTTYRMGVNYSGEQTVRRAPEAWFSFDPAEVTLAPGETAPVSVTLDIPAGARPDDYEALIQAEIAPVGEGTTVGAAAAARLKFTVKPSNILQAWQLETETWFGDNQPWTIVVPAVAALVALAWWMRRRFTISIGRRD